jgi:hypothetical protein
MYGELLVELWKDERENEGIIKKILCASQLRWNFLGYLLFLLFLNLYKRSYNLIDM